MAKTIASFRAWTWGSFTLAYDCARDRRCAIGFCIHDGRWYAADFEELVRGGMLYIQSPVP